MASLTAGDISLRFSLILGGIGRGLSGNQIIKELQDAGLGARRQTLLGLITQARSFYAAQPVVAGLDYANPVPEDAVTSWPSRSMTGYGHVVQILTRDIGTGTPGVRWYTAVSDQLMTPAQAIQQAFDVNADAAQTYEYTMVGGILSNVIAYTPMEV